MLGSAAVSKGGDIKLKERCARCKESWVGESSHLCADLCGGCREAMVEGEMVVMRVEVSQPGVVLLRPIHLRCLKEVTEKVTRLEKRLG